MNSWTHTGSPRKNCGNLEIRPFNKTPVTRTDVTGYRSQISCVHESFVGFNKVQCCSLEGISVYITFSNKNISCTWTQRYLNVQASTFDSLISVFLCSFLQYTILWANRHNLILGRQYLWSVNRHDGSHKGTRSNPVLRFSLLDQASLRKAVVMAEIRGKS